MAEDNDDDEFCTCIEDWTDGTRFCQECGLERLPSYYRDVPLDAIPYEEGGDD